MPELDVKTHENFAFVIVTSLGVLQDLADVLQIKGRLDERWRFCNAFLDTPAVVFARDNAWTKRNRLIALSTKSRWTWRSTGRWSRRWRHTPFIEDVIVTNTFGICCRCFNCGERCRRCWQSRLC
jgi:hypothetical protein